MTCSDEAIRGVLMDLAQERGRGRSFCPSEAARRLAPEWRQLMPDIRRVAQACAAEGLLCATQRGRPVDPRTARGPIRLALP
ncbi:DUF3253 domain-containing protein [Cereibacter sphaeroides]|uniref:DUF3253 domain-containing protein n=1 Tax=Rhodobacterales TaxID=204455 RepID=UPI000BBE594B|nr:MULTISPECIES: DUF3253 domain-containing protein [Paracoccaceae]MCE6950044.1 DUF3253 domain-containing protein [Cereibacter sphaeroides]MCE6958240.1 DUF3253 domain-containing protein [Cereibacter sphaeroides]MCE6967719.1 DUF3253 domain-containing protein [Cereibacter sphaeroides]MCE6972530.1 DUF3253 domain-containing protein [Cereibacter sphaeroides]